MSSPISVELSKWEKIIDLYKLFEKVIHKATLHIINTFFSCICMLIFFLKMFPPLDLYMSMGVK